MKNIAIRRLRVLPILRGDGLGPKHRLVLLSELARLGVRLTNEALLAQANTTTLGDHASVMDTLRSMKGGDVDYVPLFLGFPDAVPDDGEYFAQRVVAYLGNVFGAFDADTPTLDDGARVPAWLFDLQEFGADPISQLQDKSLWERAKSRMGGRAPDRHTEWLDLELAFADTVEGRLKEWLRDCLYAKSSVKAALHADVRRLLTVFGAEALEWDKIAMKENQALVLRCLWQAGQEEAAAKLLKTPTDMLRLMAALTDTDISLASKVSFPRLRRPQRRLLMAALERAPALAEDLTRHRGLWLAVARSMHVGEHAKRYPRVAAAFDALRNRKIETFASRTEALFHAGELDAALAHLRSRPGVLGRKLHELLRRFPDSVTVVLREFDVVAHDITLKNLLVLRRYFATINDEACRTVINKSGKIKVLPNNALNALPTDVVGLVVDRVDTALRERVGALGSWEDQTVWIDPALAKYTVPVQQRAASDGLLTVGRGSRVPLDPDKVLRLFVYWKEVGDRTDLDLSVIEFGDGFTYEGHVSYTNLTEAGIAHSGDLQSAPHGAAEFVDISLGQVTPGVRYLAVQVHRYCGDSFAALEACHAGWMVRADVDPTYETFDIKTVVNKVDLQGVGGYCVPLIVDLKMREVILVDLTMGSKVFHNNVEGSYGSVSAMVREVSRFPWTRPSMLELAQLHVEARCARRVKAPDGASITFGVRGCTYNATDIETVLADLL